MHTQPVNSKRDFSVCYTLRHIIFCGAAASSSAVFSVLFLLFMDSMITHHPPLMTDTVSEMVGYAEFFAFAFGSYFIVSVITYNWRKVLREYVPVWLPIAAGGSLVFCFSFFTRVWIGTTLTHEPNNPFSQAPPNYLVVLLSTLVVAGILTVVTGIFTAVASCVYENRQPATRLNLR